MTVTSQAAMLAATVKGWPTSTIRVTKTVTTARATSWARELAPHVVRGDEGNGFGKTDIR
ncbi:hypothetical protein FHX42_001251 [Saccharopolyspora lacisalsi]|uniref:Uncharacterized protein n=1 Tax=Halosaccharopolyspora lacisalsi TaxID=1000566 RepID=A0A839DPJ7_9PSEU|nr:hypothetical protein [Halosaccharopolyspora lacisalsi]MBA8823922.1 hypothetical protein [Halosaccharopolyspora lacisalsi]